MSDTRWHQIDDLMIKHRLDNFLRDAQRSGETYGHAEDRLVGLVNVTFNHFECSAKKKMQKKREEMESVKKEETRDKRGKKKEEQAGRGARKKKLPREEKRPPATNIQSGSPGG